VSEDRQDAMTPTQATEWWVCDGPLPAGGRKVTGPFATQELAITVRNYVERAGGRTDLWVDDEAREQQPVPELAAMTGTAQAQAALARVLSWFPLTGTRNEASATRAQLAHAYQDGGLTVPEELRRFL
jgi:hypothetical protein